ncbi:MAG TPA: carbohydrate kinase family protein, partial [Firmicutes bacterium]|nr:carbohydrate kinase family protein [Bacillota bacterium]
MGPGGLGMRIIVAGHLCLDIIPHWQTGTLAGLRPGKMVQMEGVTFSTGGAVSNTGIALKRLGFDPYLVARTGDDHVGDIIRSILRREKINPDSIAVSPGATTSYTVVLNPPGTDRIFLHYPGTNDSFSVQDVQYGTAEAGLLHFGYPPLMRQMYQDQGVNLKL